MRRASSGRLGMDAVLLEVTQFSHLTAKGNASVFHRPYHNWFKNLENQYLSAPAFLARKPPARLEPKKSVSDSNICAKKAVTNLLLVPVVARTLLQHNAVHISTRFVRPPMKNLPKKLVL